MAILLNIILKASILKIMHGLWKKKQRVTYYDFSEFVRKNHPLETTLHIPEHTFSLLLHEFLQDKCIIKYNNSELHNIITESILKAIQEGIHERNELQNYVNNFLNDRKIYSPSALVLDRMIGNITRDAMFNQDRENIHLFSKIIGKDITSIEFVKEFEIKNQYISFPPMYEGKLGVKKLTSEYNILFQIKEMFQKEGLEFEKNYAIQLVPIIVP